MKSLILRIDDRLIHGQVLVGWVSYYNFRQIVVGNNEIVSNDWEKEMMTMAAGDLDTQVLNISDTLAFINTFEEKDRLALVLVESVGDVLQMVENGLKLKNINIGGIHYSDGKREFLPYLFLDANDIRQLKIMMAKGYEFICQDVPTGSKYNLEKILGKKND